MGYDRGDSFPFNLNQIDFHLVQNRKENCLHDHIPLNVEGNRNIVFSVRVCDSRAGSVIYSPARKTLDDIKPNFVLYSIYYMYIVCRIEGSGGQTIKSIMNRDNNLLILFYVCINVWFLSWMLTNVCKKCFAKVRNISNKSFVGMAPHCVSWSSIYIWIWCRPSASLLHQCDIKAPQLVRHKEV